MPQEGHPRHVNGDSEEGEGGGYGGNGGGGDAKEGQGAGEPAGPSAPGPSCPGTASAAGAASLEGRVAAMQAQLEEQGRLLRAVAAQLAGGGGSEAELELPQAAA